VKSKTYFIANPPFTTPGNENYFKCLLHLYLSTGNDIDREGGSLKGRIRQTAPIMKSAIKKQ
jgi:hypothetical protein